MKSSKFKTFAILICTSMFLFGCSKESQDLNNIKQAYEGEPNNYDDLMKAGNDAAPKRPETAMKWYRKAMEHAQNDFGPNDGRVATAAGYDAELAKQLGRMGEAEELYRKVYEIDKVLYKPGAPDLVTAQKNLADVLVSNFKPEEAKKVYPELKLPEVKPKASKPKAH